MYSRHNRIIVRNTNKISFSKIEIRHLFAAWVAISIAFSIVLSKSGASFYFGVLTATITVGLGFLLHELGHKFVAQRYRYFAEFRANFGMLLIAVLLSFTGLLFAAPGAVVIFGHVPKKEYGKISMAGPLVNLFLALIFLLLALTTEGVFSDVFNYGYLINVWIALFNLIPFGPLDGRKILSWSKSIFVIMVIVGILMLIISPFLGIKIM